MSPRILIAVVVASIAMGASGCAPTRDALGLEAVADERAARAEARVEALLASYADYLMSRWPGIVVPEVRIEQWVGSSAWEGTFERCASEASGLAVQVDATAGVFAIPAPSTATEQRDFDVSIYLCQGRYPPPNLGRTEPGPVEIAWVTAYARDALPTCLRRQGVSAQPLPDDPFAILSGGATPGWDPYAAARGNTPELRRLQALCPHPSVLLASISPVGETRGESRDETRGESRDDVRDGATP